MKQLFCTWLHPVARTKQPFHSAGVQFIEWCNNAKTADITLCKSQKPLNFKLDEMKWIYLTSALDCLPCALHEWTLNIHCNVHHHHHHGRITKYYPGSEMNWKIKEQTAKKKIKQHDHIATPSQTNKKICTKLVHCNIIIHNIITPWQFERAASRVHFSHTANQNEIQPF